MPSHTERSRYRFAAHGVLAVLLVLAAIPSYLVMEPSWRPVAIRLACAMIVVAGCVRVIRGVRRAIEGHPSSALDTPPPVLPAQALDERFLRLRDELVFSTRSRRYFDTILWPRMLRLAGTSLPQPAERPGTRRRGPSLSTLEHLISEVEKRP
jgi:hypothetical protein